MADQHEPETEIYTPPAESGSVRLRRKMRRVSSYLKEHGLGATIKRVFSESKTQGSGSSSSSTKRLVFVSHRLDTSGAPFVLVDLVREVKSAMPDAPVEFFTYQPAAAENVSVLNKLGIKPRVVQDRNASIPFNTGDVVLLNTTAFRQNLIDDVLAAARSGKVAKLFWYVHEDEPELLFSTFGCWID